MKKMILYAFVLLAAGSLSMVAPCQARSKKVYVAEDSSCVKRRVVKVPREEYVMVDEAGDQEVIVCQQQNNNSGLLYNIAAAPVYVGLGVLGLFGIKAIIGVGGLLLGAI